MTALIFDRDGVLTSFDVPSALAYINQVVPLSFENLLHRWHEWGIRHGFPKNPSEEQRFFHGLWWTIGDEFDLAADDRQHLLTIDYVDYMSVFSDVVPTLKAAKRQGLKVGVLSNFSLATLEYSLEKIGLGPYIDAACAATVIGAAKPDPRAYHIVCSELDEDPSSCLYFDDEVECVVGAHQAGLRAWLVNRCGGAVPQHLPSVTSLTSVLQFLDTSD